MKIISNFKDYYDYLTGIYGIDPKVVYERKLEVYNPSDIMYLSVLGKKYLYVRHNNKVYITLEELKDLYKKKDLDKLDKDYIKKYLKGDNKNEWWIKDNFINDYPSSEANNKTGKPVLAHTYKWNDEYLNDWSVCRLKDFQFNRILSAEEIFLQLTDWLSYKEPEIKTPPEDMNRFESKGFDKKTSFRNM